MHRKHLQHSEKKASSSQSWAECLKKVAGDQCVLLVVDIMEGAGLQGAQPFSKNQANKRCFAPTERAMNTSKGSASLQGTHCSAAAWLLLRSHTRAVTQISSTFRHYPEVVLCLQDSFPLPKYLGKMLCFPFIYRYKLEE